jgi:hypothetical protein
MSCSVYFPRGIVGNKRSQQVPGLFTAADYQALRSTRRNLNDMIIKMDKAQACGLDCTAWRQARDSIDAQLAQIEQLFMSPPPA